MTTPTANLWICELMAREWQFADLPEPAVLTANFHSAPAAIRWANAMTAELPHTGKVWLTWIWNPGDLYDETRLMTQEDTDNPNDYLFELAHDDARATAIARIYQLES